MSSWFASTEARLFEISTPSPTDHIFAFNFKHTPIPKDALGRANSSSKGEIPAENRENGCGGLAQTAGREIVVGISRCGPGSNSNRASRTTEHPDSKQYSSACAGSTFDKGTFAAAFGTLAVATEISVSVCLAVDDARSFARLGSAGLVSDVVACTTASRPFLSADCKRRLK